MYHLISLRIVSRKLLDSRKYKKFDFINELGIEK